MTGQRKDQRRAVREREGSNLIWLNKNAYVCACVCECVRTQSVKGLWEWDRRASLLNGAFEAKSSGESPQTMLATQRGIIPENSVWLAIHTQVAPQRPLLIILPFVSFTSIGNKMFAPCPLVLFPQSSSSFNYMAAAKQSCMLCVLCVLQCIPSDFPIKQLTVTVLDHLFVSYCYNNSPLLYYCFFLFLPSSLCCSISRTWKRIM